MTVGAMRAVVILRDRGCVARRVDASCGPCFDQWGSPVRHPMASLELDYVRHGAKGRHHELASDHVALCPGHHRGMGPVAGHVWATAHRVALREYLLTSQETGERRVSDDDGEP